MIYFFVKVNFFLKLFNGNIVDRGKNPHDHINHILTLLAYKVACPNCIYINKGNHEIMDTNQNKDYGIINDCLKTYDQPKRMNFYCRLNYVMSAFPICAVIQKQIFVVNGGMTGNRSLTLNEINNLDRLSNPVANTDYFNLLWADPHPQNKQGISQSNRGATNYFGPDVTDEFLKNNGLSFMIRSHQNVPEGCIKNHDNCYTLFSASN
jgi:serine/threonine-protein phosphatase 5